MVAITGGAGLGWDGIQRQFMFGTGVLGRDAGKLALNVVSGNLLYGRRDDIVMARGADLEAERTYNSQGDATGTGDWNFDFERDLKLVAGSLNVAGSVLERRGADGYRERLEYDAGQGCYLGRGGDGLVDRLSVSADGAAATWCNGGEDLVETYRLVAGGDNGATRFVLSAITDASGNTDQYLYGGSPLRLERIVSASGDLLYIDYDARGRVAALRSSATVNGILATSTSVRYDYDDLDRLTCVSIDLSPEDNSVADGRVYQTRYGYDGNSQRIRTLNQSDGTALQFEYVEVDGQYRVSLLADLAAGRTTSITYDTGARRTIVQEGQAATIYRYDSAGRLLEIILPATDGGSSSLSYTYGDDGRVASSTDAAGVITTFVYDADGHLLRESNPAATVQRTYDAAGHLVSESVSGPNDQNIGATAYRAYDVAGRLRFRLSAEGRLTQYDYDQYGNCTVERDYLSHLVDQGALGVTPPTEAALLAWVGQLGRSADDSGSTGGKGTADDGIGAFGATASGGDWNGELVQVRRTDYAYDQRGTLTRSVRSLEAWRNGALQYDPASAPVTTVFAYDAKGRLRSTADSSANTTAYTYDGLDRVLTVKDPQQQLSTFHYDASCSYTLATSAAGRTVRSFYDVAGHLIGRSEQGGPLAENFYDALGNLRMETDADGVYVLHLVNAVGQELARIAADGSVTTYGYNRAGQRVKTIRHAHRLDQDVLDTLVQGGRPSALLLTPMSGAAGFLPPADAAQDRVEWQFFNAAGSVAASVDANGQVAEYAYDARGQLLVQVVHANPLSLSDRAALTVQSRASDVTMPLTPECRVTRNLYDADGLWRGVLDGEGFLTERIYDGAGRLSKTVRYANRAAVPAGASSLGWPLARPEWSNADQYRVYLYGTDDHVTGEIDEEGFLVAYSYDSNGRKVMRRAYARACQLSLATPEPCVLSLADVMNHVASDPTDEVTTYTYYAQGWLKEELAWTSNNSRALVTRHEYDLDGRLVARSQGIDSATARRTSWRLDDGRRGREVQENGAGDQTVTQRDAAGRVLSSRDGNQHLTRMYYNAAGQLVLLVDDLGQVTQNTYTAFGQLESSTRFAARLDPSLVARLEGGRIDASLAEAVRALRQPAQDATTVIRYDRSGREVARTDAEGNQVLTGYDTFGDVLTLEKRDAAGVRTTRYGYDRRGLQVAAQIDPAGLALSSRTEFDAFGRAELSVDANGNRVRHVYDRRGRELALAVAGATGAFSTVARSTYDAFGHVLTQTDGNNLTTTYRYEHGDVAGRVMTVSSPGGVVTRIQSNEFGEQWRVTDGVGQTTIYEYDRAGRLQRVRTPSGSVSATAYDRNGNVIQTTAADGQVLSYVYDAANRVLGRSSAAGSESYRYEGRTLTLTDASGLVTRTVYDRLGRIASVTRDPDGLNICTTYAYDGDGRTVHVVEGAGTENATATRYRYDAAGRRVEEIRDEGQLHLATRYFYDGDDHVLARVDPDGRVWRFAYDARGNQVLAVGPDGAASAYAYDGAGHRTGETDFATLIDASKLPAPSEMRANWAALLVPAAAVGDRHRAAVYNRDGRLAYSVGSGGEVIAYSYDGNGNVVTRTEYANPVPNWTVRLPTTMPASAAALVGANAADRISRMLYDKDGRATFVLGPNRTVEATTYDAGGRVLSTTTFAEALPATIGFSMASVQEYYRTHASNADRVAVHVYDAAGRPALVVGRDGEVDEYAYDAAGRQSAHTRYAAAITDWPRGAAALRTVADVRARLVLTAGQDRTDNTVYDGSGRVLYEVAADGAVTEYVRDLPGHATATVRYANRIGRPAPPSLSRAALEQQLVPCDADRVTVQCFDGAGRLECSVGPAGEVERIVYDAFGREVRRIQYAASLAPLAPDGTQLGISLDNALCGPLTAQAILLYLDGLPSSEHAADRVRAIRYDAQGRVTAEIAPDGSATSYQHNVFGHVVGVRQHALAIAQWPDPQDASLPANDSADRVTARIVDADGRTVFECAPDATVTGFTYDGFGRLKTKIRYDNAPAFTVGATAYARVAAERDRQSAFLYSTDGRRSYQVDEGGEILITEYNGFGQASSTRQLANVLAGWNGASVLPPTSMLDALRSGADRMVFNAYDHGGRLSGTMDGTGRTVLRHFDAFNAMDRVTETAALGSVDLATGRATWPAGGIGDRRNFTLDDPIGQRRIRVDANGVIDIDTLNRFGDVIRTTRLANVLEGWAGGSRRNTVTLSDLLQLQGPGDRVVRRAAYDAAGRIVLEQDGDGVTIGYRYEAAGQLVLTTHYAGTGGVSAEGAPTAPAPATADTHSAVFHDIAHARVFEIDRQGVVLLRQKDEFGQEVTMSRLAARITDFGALTAGQLATLPGAGATLLERTTFDRAGRAVYELDAVGAPVRHSYDAQGRLVRSVAYATLYSGALDTAALDQFFDEQVDGVYVHHSVEDRCTAYVFREAAGLHYVIDAGGAVTRRRTDRFGKVVEETAIAQRLAGWSGEAPVPPFAALEGLREAAADRTVLYAHDAAGRLVRRTDAEGTTTEFVLDAFGEPVLTLRRYGAEMRRSAMIAWPEMRARFEVDDAGAVILRVKDQSGQEESVRRLATRLEGWAAGRNVPAVGELVQLIDDAQDRLTRTKYDSSGRKVSEIDPEGYVTTWQYDPNGDRVLTVRHAHRGVAGADGNVNVQDDPADLRSLSWRDAATGTRYMVSEEGWVASERLDTAGRLQSRTESGTELAGWVGGSDLPSLAVLDALAAADRAGNRSWYHQYDAAGRETAVLDTGVVSTAADRGHAVGYQRNAFGDIVLTTRYADLARWIDGAVEVGARPEADLRTASVADPLNHRRFTVDEEGRVNVEVINAFGQRESSIRLASFLPGWAAGAEAGRDALATLLEAGGGRSSYVTYDRVGRQHRTLAEDGSTVERQYNPFGDPVLTITYDGAGDWDGHAITVGPDSARDRRVGQFLDLAAKLRYDIDALGQVVVSRLDAFGGVLEQVQRAARVSAWATAGKPTLAMVPAAGVGDLVLAQRSYDHNGRVMIERDAERRVSAHAYDAFGGEMVIEYADPDGVNVAAGVAPAPGARDHVRLRVRDAAHHAIYVVDHAGGLTVEQADAFGQTVYARRADALFDARKSFAAAWLTEGMPPSGLVPALASCAAGGGDTTRTQFGQWGQKSWTMDGSGLVTGFEYDDHGALVRQVRYAGEASVNGASFVPPGPSAADRPQRYLRDRVLHRSYSQEEDGLVRLEECDALGLVLESRLLRAGPTEFPPPTTAADPRTVVVADPEAGLTYRIDEEGFVTIEWRDRAGQLLRSARLDSAIAGWAPLPGNSGGSAVPIGSSTADAPVLPALTAEGLRYLASAAQRTLAATVYRLDGKPASSTDALGRRTEFDYDAFGRLQQSVIDGAGDGLRAQSDTQRSAIVRSADGRVRYLIDGEGQVRRERSDGFGRLVEVVVLANAVDEWGPEATMPTVGALEQLSGAGNVVIERTRYDDAGNVALRVNGVGDAIGYTYDANGNVLVETRYARAAGLDGNGEWQVQPDQGDRHTLRYRDMAARREYTLDAGGGLTIRSFNIFGQETLVSQNPNAYTAWPALAGTNWDGSPVQVRELVAELPAPGGADRVLKRSFYTNGTGALAFEMNAVGVVTGYRNDRHAGRQLSVRYSVPATIDAAGNLRLPAGAAGAVSAQVRDRVAHTTYAIDPMGSVVQTVTDCGGRVLREVALARQVESWANSVPNFPSLAALKALGSAADHAVRTVSYDRYGQIASMVDAGGNLTTFEYDALGRQQRSLAYAEALAGWGVGSSYGGTPPAGEVRVQARLFDRADRTTAEIDPMGYLSHTYYTTAGQVRRSVRHAQEVNWTASWPPTAQQRAALDAWSGSADRQTLSWFDAAGRARVQVNGDGYASATEYDRFGAVVLTIDYQLPLADPAQALPDSIVRNQSLGTALSWLTSVDGSGEQSAWLTRTEYDRNGHAVRQVAPDGTVTANVYDIFGRLTDVTVAAGTVDAVTTHRSYDACDRVLEEVTGWDLGTQAPRSDAVSVLHSYNDLSREERILSPRGATTGGVAPSTTIIRRDLTGRVLATLTRDETSGITFTSSSATYDAFGNAILTVDANGAASHAYFNALNQNVLSVDAVGQAIGVAFDAFGNRQAIIRYVRPVVAPAGLLDRPLPETDPSDGITLLEHDMLGRQTGVRTNAGLHTAATYEARKFNAFGELETKTIEGAVWSYTYDHSGRCVVETVPVQASGAAQQLVVNRNAYDRRGKLIRSIEAEGTAEQRITWFDYDAAGRMIRKTGSAVVVYDPVAGALATAAPQEAYGYDRRGNRISSTDGNGATTWSGFDIFNHETARVGPDGAMTQWSRDALGNAYEMRRYAQPVSVARDSRVAPAPATSTTPEAEFVRVTSYRFDYAGRTVETSVDGLLLGAYSASAQGGGGFYAYTGAARERKAYDRMGNLLRETDANGNVKRHFYDATGRSIADVDGNGHVTTREYTALSVTVRKYGGAPVALTDASTLADLLRAVASVADVHVATDTLNARGDIVASSRSIGDGRTATVERHYNSLAKLERIVEAEMSTSDIAVTRHGRAFRYDVQGRTISELVQQWQTPINAPDETTTTLSRTDLAYNGLGLLKRRTQVGLLAGESDRVASYYYDAMGRRDREVDPTGVTRSYAYDAAGRRTREQHLVTTVTETGSSTAMQTTSVRYDAVGRAVRETITLGTNPPIVRATRYNLYGEMTGRAEYDGVGEPVWTETWEYDAAGRVWRTNAGGGTKVNLFDANGNASMTFQSLGDLDLGATSRSAIWSLAHMAGTSGLPAMSLRMAVYDGRNQVVRTLTPRDDIDNVMRLLTANLAAQNASAQPASFVLNQTGQPQGGVATAAVPTGAVIGLGHNAISLPITVRVLGTLTNTDLTSSVSYTLRSLSIDLGAAGEVAANDGGAGYEIELVRPDGTVAQVVTAGTTSANVLDFNLSDDAAYRLDAGNVRVYRRRWAAEGEDGRVLVASGGFSVPAGVTVRRGAAVPQTGEFNITANLSVLATPSALLFAGQPPDVSGVLVGYRMAGSNAAFRFFGTAARLDSHINDFMFTLPPGQLSAGMNYEYCYFAMDPGGQVLNQGTGNFVLSSTGQVSTSNPAMPVGANGYGLRIDTGSGVQVAFLAQGRTSGSTGAYVLGTRATIRYRAVGSSAWTNANLPSGSHLGGFPGSFSWNPPQSGLYEYELTVYDGANAVVNQAGGRINNGALASYGKLQDMQGRARIGNLPPETKTIKVGVAAPGSTNFTWTVLTPLASDPSTFLFDVSTLAPHASTIYAFDLRIDAYDDRNTLLAGTTASLRLGGSNVANASVVSNLAVRFAKQTPASYGPAGAVSYAWKLGGLNAALMSEVQQAYDAFGNLVRQTDAMGNVSTQTFDHGGRVLTQSAARIAALDATGQFVASTDGGRVTVRHAYDLDGNLVSSTDANGNTTNFRYKFATDQDGKRLMDYETHADGGHVYYLHDSFGALIKRSEELTAGVYRETSYGYDAHGRLERVSANGETDTYGYDENGRRIWSRHHEDRLDGAWYDVVTRSQFDQAGRVKRTDFASNTSARLVTTYDYTYNSVVRGWQTATTEAGSGRTTTALTDYFGRTLQTSDLSGVVTAREYDKAGRLRHQQTMSARTGMAAQNLDYSYYGSGAVRSLRDNAALRVTDYIYDANGNKRQVKLATLPSAGRVAQVLNLTTMAYDGRNQLVRVVTADADIALAYDLNGNVRRRQAYYTQADTAGIVLQKQEYWYLYDAMNRMTVSMGQLNVSTDAQGRPLIKVDWTRSGAAIGYDYAGRRTTVTYGFNALDDASTTRTLQSESYVWDNKDRLMSVDTVRDGVKLHSERIYLTARDSGFGQTSTVIVRDYDGGTGVGAGYSGGRLKSELKTEYELDGRVRKETSRTNQYYGGDHANELKSWTDSTTSYIYGADRNLYTRVEEKATQNRGVPVYDKTISTTNYDYVYLDQAQVKSSNKVAVTTRHNADNTWSAPPDGEVPVQSRTSNRFDSNGHVIRTVTWDSTPGAGAGLGRRSRNQQDFLLDENGGVLRQDQTDQSYDEQAAARGQALTTVAHRYTRSIVANGRTEGSYTNQGAAQKKYNLDGAPAGFTRFNAFTASQARDTDQNFQAIAQQNGPAFGMRYIVRQGDTLRSIARAKLGDEDAWFYLADANGLSAEATLAAGTSLSIPNEFVNASSRFTADTQRLYLGSNGVDIPPVGRGDCGQSGVIMAQAMSTIASVAVSAACGFAASVLFGTGVGAPLAIAIGAVTGAAAAAAGNAAGQLFEIATDMKDASDFDFRSLGIAAAVGAAGGALGAAGGQLAGVMGEGFKAALGAGPLSEIVQFGIGAGMRSLTSTATTVASALISGGEVDGAQLLRGAVLAAASYGLDQVVNAGVGPSAEVGLGSATLSHYVDVGVRATVDTFVGTWFEAASGDQRTPYDPASAYLRVGEQFAHNLAGRINRMVAIDVQSAREPVKGPAEAKHVPAAALTQDVEALSHALLDAPLLLTTPALKLSAASAASAGPVMGVEGGGRATDGGRSSGMATLRKGQTLANFAEEHGLTLAEAYGAMPTSVSSRGVRYGRAGQTVDLGQIGKEQGDVGARLLASDRAYRKGLARTADQARQRANAGASDANAAHAHVDLSDAFIASLSNPATAAFVMPEGRLAMSFATEPDGLVHRIKAVWNKPFMTIDRPIKESADVLFNSALESLHGYSLERIAKAKALKADSVRMAQYEGQITDPVEAAYNHARILGTLTVMGEFAMNRGQDLLSMAVTSANVVPLPTDDQLASVTPSAIIDYLRAPNLLERAGSDGKNYVVSRLTQDVAKLKQQVIDLKAGVLDRYQGVMRAENEGDPFMSQYLTVKSVTQVVESVADGFENMKDAATHAQPVIKSGRKFLSDKLKQRAIDKALAEAPLDLRTPIAFGDMHVPATAAAPTPSAGTGKLAEATRTAHGAVPAGVVRSPIPLPDANELELDLMLSEHIGGPSVPPVHGLDLPEVTTPLVLQSVGDHLAAEQARLGNFTDHADKEALNAGGSSVPVMSRQYGQAYSQLSPDAGNPKKFRLGGGIPLQPPSGGGTVPYGNGRYTFDPDGRLTRVEFKDAVGEGIRDRSVYGGLDGLGGDVDYGHLGGIDGGLYDAVLGPRGGYPQLNTVNRTIKKEINGQAPWYQWEREIYDHAKELQEQGKPFSVIAEVKNFKDNVPQDWRISLLDEKGNPVPVARFKRELPDQYRVLDAAGNVDMRLQSPWITNPVPKGTKWRVEPPSTPGPL